MIFYILDMLRNSTSTGNLGVGTRLESVTKFEYTAGRDSVSPTNPFVEANFAICLLIIY